MQHSGNMEKQYYYTDGYNPYTLQIKAHVVKKERTRIILNVYKNFDTH